MRREPLLALLVTVLFATASFADTNSSLTVFRAKKYPAAMVKAAATADALAPRRLVDGPARFEGADPASLPFKLSIKMPPAAAPPYLFARDAAPAPPGPLPFAPLAGAMALSLAAYEVSRSRAAYASAGGLDDEHPAPVGPYQRLVAGAILAGAAGALIYTMGAAVLSAAPAALDYGLRLASSEAGAINPGASKTVNDIPKMLARVIPYESGTTFPEMIGRSEQSHAFVTAAEDIEGLNAADIPLRLGIAPSSEYLVIQFPTPPTGIATPLAFDHPLFVGGGLTSGGAREFFVANDFIPKIATIEVIK